MAATVVTSSVASHSAIPRTHVGFTPYWGSVEFATTSLDDIGDDVLLFLFPLVAKLPGGPEGLRVNFDDLDTNGSPLIRSDIGLGGAGLTDGVIATVLINSSSGGTTGAQDEMDTGTDIFITADNRYLIHSIEAVAATAAAGGLEFSGMFSVGVVQLT